MGYLASTDPARSGLPVSASTDTYAIEFGGGARFWLSESFSKQLWEEPAKRSSQRGGPASLRY
jgi:hypothetical protein